MNITLLNYIQVLVWPVVATLLGWMYRDVVRALLPEAKVTFTFAGLRIETTLPEVERSLTESLHDEKLTTMQWDWLKDLQLSCRKEISHDDVSALRPLRDAGLIRAFPKGFLEHASAVEITRLGRILIEAKRQRE